MDLRPYSSVDAVGDASWWLASDLGELATGGRLATDHVLGAGGASAHAGAGHRARPDAARVLDVGTGCGIQALHAARHAQRVVATDISRRALAFAEFNVALNTRAGTDVELGTARCSSRWRASGSTSSSRTRRSSSPRTRGGRPDGRRRLGDYEYRDGGRAGDDLVRDLVRGVGGVLAPGGVAQLLGNWEHRRGEPWTERVGAWLDEAGLDAWIIQREVLDPAEYAETWIRDGGTTPDREPDAWAAAYGAWLDDFASRDVEAVGFGIRDPPAPRVRAAHAAAARGAHRIGAPAARGAPRRAASPAHDWLASRDDAALAAAHLVTAADVTEERYLTPGEADPNVVILRQGDGLGRGVQASSPLAALVGACDGELTVGQIVGALASLFDVPADALAAELLPAVRGLIRDGFLEE